MKLRASNNKQTYASCKYLNNNSLFLICALYHAFPILYYIKTLYIYIYIFGGFFFHFSINYFNREQYALNYIQYSLNCNTIFFSSYVLLSISNLMNYLCHILFYVQMDFYLITRLDHHLSFCTPVRWAVWCKRKERTKEFC